MFMHDTRLMHTIWVLETSGISADISAEQREDAHNDLSVMIGYFAQTFDEINGCHSEMLIDFATDELSPLEFIGNIVVTRGSRAHASKLL